MPIDVSVELRQDFVVECPVCGSPMVLRVDVQPDGQGHVAGTWEEPLLRHSRSPLHD